MTYGLHMDMKKDAGIVTVTAAQYRRSDDSTPSRRVDVFRAGGAKTATFMAEARDLASKLSKRDDVTYVVVEIQNWHGEVIAKHKWTRAKGWVTL